MPSTSRKEDKGMSLFYCVKIIFINLERLKAMPIIVFAFYSRQANIMAGKGVWLGRNRGH